MFYFWSIYLISFFIWDNLILLLYPKSFPNLDVSMLDVLKQVRLTNIFLKSNTTIYCRHLKHAARGPHAAREGVQCGPPSII